MAGTILVVDDSMMIRKQIGRALGGGGFTIVEAHDGADALQKLGAHAGIRLVVCDVNMPNMDGMEFLDRVRREPAHADLSVVMLTTEAQPALVERARALGAKGWLVKPFKPEMLLALANKLAA